MKRRYFAVAIGLTTAALAASLVLYPDLPDRMPVHWNIRGQVDDYAGKTAATLLAPVVMIRMLPWLSPRRFEVADTGRPTYLYVMVVVVVLMAYIHALMLAAAMGWIADSGRALVAGLCLFIALLGNVLGKIPRNMYIGVRTPWTIAAGIAGMLLVLAFGWFVAAFVAVMGSVFVPAVFSLFYYKRLERRGEI